jgi:hypothetical protein
MRTLLLLALVGAFPVLVNAAPAASELIIGKWSGGATRHLEEMRITETRLIRGKCSIAYKILKDEYREPRMSAFQSHREWKWRHISLLLQADKGDGACKGIEEVMELAIPDEMPCHADQSIFRTQEKYLAGALLSWSVWVNETCAARETPNTSLERTRDR